MKKRMLLWVTATLFSVSLIWAQSIPADAITALGRGNSYELSRYLATTVELIIQNKLTRADKNGAERALNTFFAKNKVKRFDVKHQGKRDESSFVVGALTADTGNFRVNCFFKKEQNKYLIHQIRIDKTNE